MSKGIKIELEQDTQEWLNWRTKGIGASESAVIYMAENYPYSDNIQSLWAKKTGRLEAQVIDNEFVRKGKRLEPVARQLFIEKTGIDIFPACYQHRDYSFIKASMDGINEDETVIVEIKAPTNPDRHKKAVNGEVHTEYYIQMQHQFLVTGAKIGYFVSYFENYSDNSSQDFIIIKVMPDQSFIYELFQKLISFWNYVERDIIPTEVSVADGYFETGKAGLFSLCGYAKTGKDELASAFNRTLKTKRYGFADKLKEVYCEISSISLEELTANKEKHRDGMVKLGKGLRKIFPDIWIKGIFNNSSNVYKDMSEYGVTISDTRYVNELSNCSIEANKSQVPFTSIWIDSEERGIKPANQEELETTSLLKNVCDVTFINDVQIENEEDLKKCMEFVVFHIFKGEKQIKLSEILSNYKNASESLKMQKRGT